MIEPAHDRDGVGLSPLIDAAPRSVLNLSPCEVLPFLREHRTESSNRPVVVGR